MPDTVTITIPRDAAAMWARTYNNEDVDYGALPDACRQALQQEQVVLEGDCEIGNRWDEAYLVIDGKPVTRHHPVLKEWMPKGTDHLGPVRITITPLEGEQDAE